MAMIETQAHSGALPAAGRGRSIWWRYAALFVCLQAIVQYPIWHSTVPVLSDYPNHLARIYILSRADPTAWLERFYEIHWSVLPNLAMDLLVPTMAAWLGVEVAGKLFLALILLLIPSGTIALHYALYRRWSYWPFTVFLFLYNQIFLQGVINYLFGLGLVLWALAAWIASRDGVERQRLPAFCVVAIVLFFSHLSAFCAYAVTLLAYEFGQGRDFRRMAGVVLTLLLPILLFLTLSPLGEGEGQAFNWAGLSPLHYLVAMLTAKLLAPLIPVSNYLPWLDAVTLGVVGLGLIRGYFSGALRIHHAARWPLVAAGLMVLLTPPVLFGSNMADYRLVMVIVCLLFAGSEWEQSKPHLRILAGLLLAGLLIVRMAVVNAAWAAQENGTVAYRQALDGLPAGARLFTAFPVRDYSDPVGVFKTYLPCMAIISRSIFVPSLYSLRGSQPVWLTPEFQLLKRLSPGPLITQDQILDWPQITRHYDYVLLAGAIRNGALPYGHLLPMAQGPDFTLYRVLR